ncbi:MAG: hypothetical protein HOV87_18440 [Catenulispora sp.]|nr:hypothetical protein [Catenulispora sp.]
MTGRRGFFESEDAYVRRAADETLSAASSADARLSGQIRSTEGRITALAARLDGLAQAFDAFVEAAELRRECERYWAPAAVRAFTRAHIGALMGFAPLPATTAVVDVPGYWLPTAVQGVLALLGEGGEVSELLAEASRRDAQRTAVFLVSVLGARGVGSEAGPWLAAALPPVGTGVTLAARSLWFACSTGIYGEAGHAVLREWLGALAASVESKDLENALTTFGGRPELPPRAAENVLTRSLNSPVIENSLNEAASAAAALAALRDVLSGTADPVTGADNPDDATVDLETLLTALIDEGSAPEAELLRRAAALEASARRSAEREGFRPPTAWDASVGRAADLLLADLFATAEAAAARRIAALTALVRPLATLADTLLARTAVLPSTIVVSIPWQNSVTLDHEQPFEQTLAAVHAEIERTIAAESPGSSRRQAEANRQRAEEQKRTATTRLREGADRLAEYRRRGEEIQGIAKAAYDEVMGLLGSHAESAENAENAEGAGRADKAEAENASSSLGLIR